jgi:HK97 gp10 family phage protein
MAKSSGFYFTVDFNYIPAIIASVEAKSYSAPKKVADRIATTARQIVPKVTYNLHDSIVTQVASRGKQSDILVLADYAAYVEYGTYKMSARPYLAPAFARHSKELSTELVGAIKAW